METIQRRFRLTTRSKTGLQCDGHGLFLGDAPLLEEESGRGHWRPRPIDELNRDLTARYGLPVDLSSKVGGLAAISRAIEKGDATYAQLLALQLELPDLPEDPGRTDEGALVKIAAGLRQSGLLKLLEWDESKHPRWPAGSPDGVGGEFAPAGGGSSTSSQATTAGGAASPQHSNVNQTRKLTASATHLDAHGNYVTKFYVFPPSKVGGVIVQRVLSTDRVYGQVVQTSFGWEAWEIKPGEAATDNNIDDTWRAPPRDPDHPSIAIERTITTEARFYEGITMQGLVEKHGFTAHGSGFSDEAISTKDDPHLPPDAGTAPLERQRTFTKW